MSGVRYTLLGFLLFFLPSIALAASSLAKTENFKMLVAVVISLILGIWFFGMVLEERKQRHAEGRAPEKFDNSAEFLTVYGLMVVMAAITAGPIAGVLHLLSGSSLGLTAWVISTGGVFSCFVYLKNT
jgi:heme/copper-type cytochrome/quinol oxidase subunit 3